MSHGWALRISAHNPVLLVKSKKDCANGARRIDWEMQRAIGVPIEAVKNCCGVYIVSNKQRFVIIDLVSIRPPGSTRDAKRRYSSAPVNESLEDPAAVRIKRAGKVAGIIETKQIGLDRAGNIVFRNGAPGQEKRMNEPIAPD